MNEQEIGGSSTQALLSPVGSASVLAQISTLPKTETAHPLPDEATPDALAPPIELTSASSAPPMQTTLEPSDKVSAVKKSKNYDSPRKGILTTNGQRSH